MADRVFLILSDTTAAMVEEVLRSRIVTLNDGLASDRSIDAARRMVIERAHLSRIVGQLKAPT